MYKICADVIAYPISDKTQNIIYSERPRAVLIRQWIKF